MPGNFGSRLAQLESVRIKPPEVHSIFARFPGQTPTEMFDSYMLARMAQSYTPVEGWAKLRAIFLSDTPEQRHRFLSYDVNESVGPKPPVITRHNNNDEGM